MSSRRTVDIPVVIEDDLVDTGRLLGKGGMGCVYLYRWKTHERQNVAVKKLDTTSDVLSLKEEAKILWGLHERCPYILRLYGMMNTLHGIGLVIEYMPHGNVLDFFRRFANKINVDLRKSDIQDLKYRIAMQVCNGIDFLHGLWKPVIHCDLKARNVLLDSNLDVKICDFGLAKIQRLTSRPKSDDPSRDLVNRHGGTLSHIAPELLYEPGQPTKKSDVYSYGVFLWELVTEREPYEDVSNDFMLIKFVIDGKRPEINFISPDWTTLVRIMESCWENDSSNRPPFSEIRRRIPHSPRSDVEPSAVRCKNAWEKSRATNENSVTSPKAIRSADNRGRRHPDTGTDFMDGHEPQQRFDHLNQPSTSRHMHSSHRAPLSDMRSSEILISAGDSGRARSTSTSIVEEYARDPDGASTAPLIRNSPTFAPTNRYWKCGGSKVALFVLTFILGCCAAFTIFWFTLYSKDTGCCINCFDLSTPLLKGNCSASHSSRAPVGSKCNFSCPDGYVLNGNTDELCCKQTGIWSGPLPYCRKIRQCQALKPPANSGELQCSNGWYEGSTCSFQCKEGYRLRLPGDVGETSQGDMSITCNADIIENFQWSGPEPYCEKVVQCEQLSHDDNVNIDCEPNGQSYSNGTICGLSCKDPHMSLENEKFVTLCGEDGKWNVTDEIKCVNACTSLPNPPNGNYQCNNGRKYSSTCTYNCDSKFFLVPNNIRKIDCFTKEMSSVTVAGYVKKLSSMMTSRTKNSIYFLGAFSDGTASMTLVGFSDEQRLTLNGFKENGSAIVLKDVDVRKNRNHEDLRILIHEHSIIASNTEEKMMTSKRQLSYIRNILDNNMSDINVIVYINRIDAARSVRVRDDLAALRSLWVSDSSGDIRLDLWRDDALELNTTYEITHLKLRSLHDEHILESTIFTEIFIAEKGKFSNGT